MFAKGRIYFTSTQGGGPAETGPQLILGYGRGAGQVWAYDPRRQRLTCQYQSPGTAALELPDNITARNDRGTVVLCEDGPADNYIRGLTKDAELFDIALNRLRRNNPSADGTFAPTVRRGVRRRHVQPRRRDAVRQHPGRPGRSRSPSGDRGAGSASERSPGLCQRTSVTERSVLTQTSLSR